VFSNWCVCFTGFSALHIMVLVLSIAASGSALLLCCLIYSRLQNGKNIRICCSPIGTRGFREDKRFKLIMIKQPKQNTLERVNGYMIKLSTWYKNNRPAHSKDELNWLYAQLHYFLNFSQLLVSCLPLLDKLINSGVSDLSSHNNNTQAHLN